MQEKKDNPCERIIQKKANALCVIRQYMHCKVNLTIIISDSNQCHSIPEHNSIGNVSGIALECVDGYE